MDKEKIFSIAITVLIFLFFGCTNQARGKNEIELPAKYPSTNLSIQENDTEQNSDTEKPAEESVDYSRYHLMSFYSEETIDDLYDAISYVVYIDDFNGHPLMIKDGESYYEVTGVGYSPSDFLFNGDVYKDRFYAQTVNGVYFIGVALRDPKNYKYTLSSVSPYGVSFVDVFALYRY